MTVRLLTIGTGGPLVTTAGTLGSTYTFATASNKDAWLFATLGASATITITGLVAGSRPKLLINQDATGGRTLTISDGTNTQTVTINTAASSSTTIDLYSPNGTDLWISPSVGGLQTTSPYTWTGVQTFGVGKLLMTNGTNTAEPYSDVNAPQTLNMTENANAAVTTPTGGKATLYTEDGSYLTLKDDSGIARQILPKDTDDWKLSVKVASTATITLPPGGTTLTIDGYACVNGDRVLLKDQTTAAQNGIYVVSGIGTSVVLTRSTDADSITEITGGMTVYVTRGTIQRDTLWALTTDSPVTLGTSAISFNKIADAGGGYNWNHIKDPWYPGGPSSPSLLENMPRYLGAATGSIGTTTQATVYGGFVIPANTTISSIATLFVAGGTVTGRWFALIDVATRTVRAVTANTTTAPATVTLQGYSFATPYTPISDTAVWVVWGNIASVSSTVASATVNATLAMLAPAYAGILPGYTPTATPPTVGTVIGTAAPTTGVTVLPYFRLA